MGKTMKLVLWLDVSRIFEDAKQVCYVNQVITEVLDLLVSSR